VLPVISNELTPPDVTTWPGRVGVTAPVGRFGRTNVVTERGARITSFP